MKLIIGLIICIIALIGCKTTESNLTDKSKAKTELSVEKETSSDLKDNSVKSEEKSDKSQTDENVNKSTDETLWSKPDSLGNQYKVKTTHTEENRNTKTKADVKTKADSKADVDKKDKAKSKADSKADIKKDIQTEDKTEIQNPDWMNWAVGIGLIVLGVIAYFFLRRFGLIK